MSNGKKDEDSFNLIIGLILIVFVALALIWALSGISSCPEDTYSCDGSISSCGCCIDDANGNSIESCDYNVCPEGTYFFEGMGCCSSPNPASCLGPYTYCKVIVPCGESYCCGTDKCEIQTNGSTLCIPCSVNSVCNPTDVNSCCDGFACGSDGFCKKLDSCIGMECTNYGGPCQICSSTGESDCIGCKDNSICTYDSSLNKGVCEPVSCKGNSCNFLGQQCSFSPTIPCSETCVNSNGAYTCLPTSGCPEGSYPCNLPGCGGCCDIFTGECVSCLDNPCSIEQEGEFCSSCDTTGLCTSCPESICKNEKCVPVGEQKCVSPLVLVDGNCINPNEPNNDTETLNCDLGYFYNLDLKKCISKTPVKCNNPTCTFENEGEHCIEILDETHVNLCTSLCSPKIGGGYSCVIPTDGDQINPNEIPDWLSNLKSSCVEVCEDCPVCDKNPDVYDLNKDGFLNVLDYGIFMDFYNSVTLPYNVEKGNMFDFNYDELIDENDEKCIQGICSGDCRIIGVDELGVCVTGDYFNNSLSPEQRGVYPNYELMFKNVAKVPNTFDCSNINSLNQPYCLEFKKELEHSNGNILSLRNLSFVISEKNNLNLFYSSCAYMKNNSFALYVQPSSCSGTMNVFFSNNFLYRTMAYGMGVFNNCMYKAPNENTFKGTFGEGVNTITNPTFEGSCAEYKNDIMQTCIDPENKKVITLDYCESCKDFNDWDVLDKVVAGLKKLSEEDPLFVSGCAYPFGCGQSECEFYCKDVSYVIAYSGCKICKQCDSISSATTNWCNDKSISISIPDKVNSLDNNYKKYYDNCIGMYGVTSSNCILYAECRKEFNHDFCYNLAIKSFWVKKDNKFSKELYCYLVTSNYDTVMGSKYITLTESIISANILAKTSQQVTPVFSGFIKNCPAGLLCEFAPQYCFKTDFGWEFNGAYLVPGDDGPTFVFGGDLDLTKFTTNTDLGVAGKTSKSDGSGLKMQQDILNQAGLGSVINVEGDYGSGGGPGFGFN